VDSKGTTFLQQRDPTNYLARRKRQILQHRNIGTPSIQATEILRRTDSSLNPYSKPQMG